jgi:hypothetical protein
MFREIILSDMARLPPLGPDFLNCWIFWHTLAAAVALVIVAGPSDKIPIVKRPARP